MSSEQEICFLFQHPMPELRQLMPNNLIGGAALRNTDNINAQILSANRHLMDKERKIRLLGRHLVAMDMILCAIFLAEINSVIAGAE